MENEENKKEKDEAEEEEFSKKEIIIKVIRLVFGLALALIGNFWISEANFGLWPNFTVMLIAWLILAYDILLDAIKDIIIEHEFFSEDALMILASIGAFAIRAFGPDKNEFIEGVMVMLLFQIGEMFEDIADYRSHKAISDAIGLRAPVAHLKKEEGYQDINPEELRIGDLIEVRVGEVLPADGIIVKGEGFLDMSSLTGEPVPVKRNEGETVPSGTILKEGSLFIKVTREYKDNTVSKILNLIEEGAESKSKTTRFVDRFAKIYTPVVVILAFLLAILPPLGINMKDPLVWESWIYRSLNLLIISCPCAIVISVPLTYFSGIGLSSKHGIIIKGARVFDNLTDIETLVTDKTGTLTYGTFTITHLETGLKEEDFMEYVKASESKSNHPIAQAILKADKGAFDPNQIEDYREIAGHGISLKYRGKNLLAGNGRLLEENRIGYPASKEEGSIVYLAVDGKYEGYLVLSDIIRRESKGLVDDLHRNGSKVVMLTGDKEESARHVSEVLGIDEYHAQLLPENKTGLLKQKLDEKKKAVAYMGDGINDAASIALSDIGIAMGKNGSDLAIDNADVVIMNDNPRKVSLAIKIAKLVRTHVIFNISFSLLVKLVIMILALTVEGFPMIISVIADTGLTMILILISVLLLNHKFKED